MSYTQKYVYENLADLLHQYIVIKKVQSQKQRKIEDEKTCKLFQHWIEEIRCGYTNNKSIELFESEQNLMTYINEMKNWNQIRNMHVSQYNQKLLIPFEDLPKNVSDTKMNNFYLKEMQNNKHDINNKFLDCNETNIYPPQPIQQEEQALFPLDEGDVHIGDEIESDSPIPPSSSMNYPHQQESITISPPICIGKLNQTYLTNLNPEEIELNTEEVTNPVLRKFIENLQKDSTIIQIDDENDNDNSNKSQNTIFKADILPVLQTTTFYLGCLWATKELQKYHNIIRSLEIKRKLRTYLSETSNCKDRQNDENWIRKQVIRITTLFDTIGCEAKCEINKSEIIEGVQFCVTKERCTTTNQEFECMITDLLMHLQTYGVENFQRYYHTELFKREISKQLQLEPEDIRKFKSSWLKTLQCVGDITKQKQQPISTLIQKPMIPTPIPIQIHQKNLLHTPMMIPTPIPITIHKKTPLIPTPIPIQIHKEYEKKTKCKKAIQ